MTRILVADFMVKGQPVAKERARITRAGTSYTPEKTVEAEAFVRRAFLQNQKRYRPTDTKEHFAIEATFFNGDRRRRDLDNQLKLVLDALNDWAWADDSQVVEIVARKFFVTKDEARTEIKIWRISA
jgi:Holliday junction resolvase RusA-like endonuclease